MNGLLLLGLAGLGYWVWNKGRKRAPAMSRARAARLLEVEEDADADTVRTAHRRLIQRVHPDTGGSAELTAQVNAARDVLLARRAA